MGTPVFSKISSVAFVTGLTLVASLLSACGSPYADGGSSRRSSYSSLRQLPATGTPTVYEDGENGGDIGGTGSSSSPSSNSGAGSAPVQSFTVRAIGMNSYSVTVKANKILKVRFTPGRQDTAIAGGSTLPQYARLGAYIQVGGRSQVTGLLSNGFAGDSPQSYTVDLSSSFTRSCGGDTACRQDIAITVATPSYDYYCLNFGAYCPHTQVISTHPWNGTLEVQTDDTVAL